MKISFTFVSMSFLIIFPVVAYAGQFKVIRIYDGDTVKAIGHDVEIKVRLVGIDSPETSKKKKQPEQAYSQKATKYLAGLVLNKTVDIKGYGTDPYGRVLAEIFVDDRNVNLKMIKAGYAEVYRGKPPEGLDLEPYRQAEKNANRAKLGIWSFVNNYLSPRDWRSIQRGGR